MDDYQESLQVLSVSEDERETEELFFCRSIKDETEAFNTNRFYYYNLNLRL